MSVNKEFKSVPEQFSDLLETYRREAATIDAGPLKGKITDELGREVAVVDMAESGLLIEIGSAHLRESIINGQKERTRIAFAALKEGTDALETWLKAKGYI